MNNEIISEPYNAFVKIPTADTKLDKSVISASLNGPIYNLESFDNLPTPVQITQNVELVEGDEEDPFSPKTYRIVTTNVLPSVYVYTPNFESEESTNVNETNRNLPVPQQQMSIGELFVDLTSPSSLAPFLTLLDAKAPFVFHEVDPKENDYRSMGNMQGRIPIWIDEDTTCIWESNAIMRYVCDKHHLGPHLYPPDNLPLRTRTNIALDWSSSVLAPHIHSVLDVDVLIREDMEDLATGLYNLEKDQRVITDYFLRETPFIGGYKPNIADHAICMQLLLLYATDAPPITRIRQYLKNAAAHSKNWNEVTAVLRDFCGRHRRAMRKRQADHNRKDIDAERQQFNLESEQHKQEVDVRRRAAEDEWRKKIEEEANRRNLEYLKNAEEEAKDRQTEWDKKKRQAEEGRKRELLDLQRRLEEEKRGVEEDRKRRQEEEKQWRINLENRIKEEEQDRILFRQREEERLRREQDEQKNAAEQKLREQEELNRKEQEERDRQAEEERQKKEEEDSKRREEEEEKRRKQEEERRKKEESHSRLSQKPKPKGAQPKPYIGVMVKMLDDEDGNKDCVVVVETVPSNGPASKAGIQVDDVIKAWNGEQINSKELWTKKVQASTIGESITLQIEREKVPLDIKVVIEGTNKEMVTKTVKSKTQIGKK